MIFKFYEDDDGAHVQELDAEAIDYLIEGLLALRDLEPGGRMVTPTVIEDDDGLPDRASEHILLRAADP